MNRHKFTTMSEAKQFADIQRLNGLKAEIQLDGGDFYVMVWGYDV